MSDIQVLGEGFDSYQAIKHDEEAFAYAWYIWEFKGHNPFAMLDFITTQDRLNFRVSIEDYDRTTLFITKSYSSREHALRAVGRALDKYLPQWLGNGK